jgi:hypothetical protein
MAQKVQTTVVDDIDGSPAAETVTFGYQGHDYEIDLSESNATRLRSMMQGYANHARRASHRRIDGPGSRTAASRRRTVAIREWARASGMQVSDRGRIPQEVIEAYRAAHAG